MSCEGLKQTVTNYEFEVIYDKLIEFNKRYYSKGSNRYSIYRSVRFLNKSQFLELVNETINNPEKKISIQQLLQNKRRAERLLEKNKQFLADCENSSSESPTGLNDFLKEINASSVIDAIKKMKEGIS